MNADIVNTLFALVFAVNLIAIVWGIVMYVTEMGSEEGKKEYKGLIVGSITYLFLLMCIYAAVEWLRSLIGL